MFFFFSSRLGNFKKIDVAETGEDSQDVRGVRDGGKVVGLMIIDSGKAGVMWCEKQKMGRTGVVIRIRSFITENVKCLNLLIMIGLERNIIR